MWRIKSQLIGNCVYVGKKFDFAGIRIQVIFIQIFFFLILVVQIQRKKKKKLKLKFRLKNFSLELMFFQELLQKIQK